MKHRLSRFLHHWNRLANQKKRYQSLFWDELVAHTRWAPTPNLYQEVDIGNKLIRYPDGKRRAVRVTKVCDTGGMTFYSFASETPLL